MTEKIDPKKLGDQVVKVLKTVYDPEIPVDIYELGLIYDVFLNESNDVKVLMTLTTPNCPGTTIEFVFFANKSIEPILTATGALVSTKLPPCS